jgi:superfamily I DNA/RNA helicase
VCFNIAASRYLRRLIQEQGVGIGPDGVEVVHFYEFCSRVVGITVNYEEYSSEAYYEDVLGEALSAVLGGESEVRPYDAILVDEGQDLSDDMYRLLLALLAPKGDLLIALDTNQNLYRRNSSWKSLGISASGNTHTLPNRYRNTIEIERFADAFLGTKPDPGPQIEMGLEGASRHGAPPRLQHCDNYEALQQFLIEDIQDQLKREEYKRSEIAVIYDDKVYRAEEGPIQFQHAKKEEVRRLSERLEASGIPTKWVSEDVRAKELFDITSDRVSLVSIHSAKGLGFDLVYLLGSDQIAPSKQLTNSELNLYYVGITRAKHQLVIPYCCDSEFIEKAKSCGGTCKLS